MAYVSRSDKREDGGGVGAGIVAIAAAMSNPHFIPAPCITNRFPGGRRGGYAEAGLAEHGES